jgi:Uma2 family endonuclease
MSMAAFILPYPEGEAALEELLRIDRKEDGSAPERRVIFCGVTWGHYLAFDRRLGDDRPGPRLYYLEGELEIMTTSNEHERIKEAIGSFLDIYFEHAALAPQC